MRHTRLLQSSNTCWSCIARQTSRHIHTASRLSQYQLYRRARSHEPPPSPPPPPSKPIRQRLQDWQLENGDPLTELLALDHASALGSSSWQQELSENIKDDDDTSAYDLAYARKELFEPGDLLELEQRDSDSEPILGVFLRKVGYQLQLVDTKGRWMNVFGASVMSSHPHFVDPSLIPPILPYIPSREVEEAILEKAAIIDVAAPRTVTGPIVSALSQLKLQADEVYRHNAAILDSAHDILAHTTDLRFGGIQNITDKLLGTGPHPTLAQICAVRKAIQYAGIGFYRDNKSHKATGLYQIRSKEQVREITLARDWLRQYQEDQTRSLAGQAEPRGGRQESEGTTVVKSFLDKCRQRIQISRKTRQPTHVGVLGPSSEKYPVTAETGAFYTTELGPPFTGAERVLLRFMEYWAVQKVFRPDESLRALAPLILRGTGMYQDHDLKTFTANTFLQEIGVYDPWVNDVLFNVDLLLPTSQHSKPLERLATELSRMTSRDVSMKDSMANLRHDWGDMPAFAIDPAGSQEIDDAISVERIEGSSNEFWAHIHVANPTAFLERNDVFSKMAMHLTETLYMPELVYPLLPSWMAQERFSLQSNRPCLTLSARVNLKGEILETKIQPGMLRNVVSLTYDELPAILGTDVHETEAPWSLVVGGQIPARKVRSPPKMLPEHTEDLKLLLEIALAFGKHREEQGGIFFTPSSQDCSVYWKENFGLPTAFPRRKTGIITHGDPVIELRGSQFRSPFSFATRDKHGLLVQEMMTMGGHIAGIWCGDRNIPILYRGMASKKGNAFALHKELIQTAIDEHGFVPIAVGFEWLSAFGRSIISPEPIHHHSLGLTSYTKVTSPLRRFGDMMNHWQIEAAVREESRRGPKSLVGASGQDHASYLPYSKDHVDKMITRVEPRERMLKSNMDRAVNHWQCMAFMRAFDFGEADIPRRSTAIIMVPPTRATNSEIHVSGRLTDCSIKVNIEACGNLEAEKIMGDIALGDTWEVEYVGASSYTSKITYMPIRRIRRELDPE